MSAADPVALPALAVLAAGMVLFLAALLAARQRRGLEDRGDQVRSGRSVAGVVLQGMGIGIVWAGGPHLTLDPMSAKAIVDAVLVAILMAGAVGLFFWATRTMGRNWSIVARTRSDHSLVTNGPFAIVRHPIYVALALLMLAVAIALGHVAHLLLSVPLYAVGTWLRVREEEALLHQQFGAAFDAYKARVSAFLPGVL